MLWLKNNDHRFIAKPYIEEIARSSFLVTFQNVNFIKILFTSEGSVEIWATNNKEDENGPFKGLENFICDFSISERKTRKGFLCTDCVLRLPYKDRQQIWEEHVYEPLLEWANSFLLAGNFICLYQFSDKGASWLKIMPVNNFQTDKDLEYLIYCDAVVSN